METIAALEHKLIKLEERIAEAEQRLPAHSTKPATMTMLLDLEDERDRLLAQIKALKAGPSKPGPKGRATNKI